ncbi:peroxisomal assembly protein [Coemansia sp. RSA 1933]|nr:peroxisomal assembly protein [Coemansia sp. RSA 1933]
MPSFWTSDAPLAEIQARISLDAQSSSSSERTLSVSSTVYRVLQQSLVRRKALQERQPVTTNATDDICYASVKTNTANRTSLCVVRVVSDTMLDNTQPTDRTLHSCRASRAMWQAIARCTDADESDMSLCVESGFKYDSDNETSSIAATIEPIVPVELSEIVFGVASDQYVDALDIQDQIADYIGSQTQLYYQGLKIMVRSEADMSESQDVDVSISLTCLMCQPVLQGIICKESNPRVVITKLPTAALSTVSERLDDSDQVFEFEDIVDDQWDLGVEWFILGGIPLGSNRDRIAGAAFDDALLHVDKADAFLPDQLDNLGLAKRSPQTDSSTPSVPFTARALGGPIDVLQVLPPPYANEDIDNRAYISLAASAKAGIISGSWVLIEPERKQSFDSPSPLYLESIKSLSLKTPESSQLPLPVAKKVYIARISSPLAERRDLEIHALAALELWLSSSPPSLEASSASNVPLRVVKEGDLIAVRVSLADAIVRTSVAKVANADAANRLRDSEQEIDSGASDVNPVTDLELERTVVNSSDQRTQGSVSENDLVFYQVVTAEGFRHTPETSSLPYSLKSLNKRDSPDSAEIDSASDSSDSEYDSDEELDYDLFKPASADNVIARKWAVWYHQVRGKGFIVLPQITMVVQAGSVNAHVPYHSMRRFALSQMQSPYSDPAEPAGGTASGALDAPYANVQSQLVRLGNASLHPLAITHKLVSATLLKGNPGAGKRHIIRAVADTLDVHLYELSCYDILSDTEDKTAKVLQMYFDNVRRYTPCIFHLRNLEALALATNAPPGQENADDLPIARVLETCIADISRVHRQSGFPIIVIATTSQSDKLPTSLATVFRHEVELSVPDEHTRLMLLNSVAESSLHFAPDADLAYIAQQTASFVARDLAMLIKRAEKHAWRRAHGVTSTLGISRSADVADSKPMLIRDLALSGQAITHDDLLGALSEARASMSDTLGVPKIPNVKWDDVGGLADAKKDILDTIRLPMEQPHLFASGLNTRSGLLFYGPPGTGKTLLAKAIATECGLNFFSCKGPELISPYIGESEANVRRIFQKAREASPCVVFFDELDSLAPKRGQQGDSGGVMDRIVSQLLAELDGMSGGSGKENEDSGKSTEADGDKVSSSTSAVQVVAIGATNRPDLLDPALLRPGRFDKLVYLGVSETHEAQLNIIQALTRKFHLHSDLDLRKVADQCPFHYTGADFYALSSDALLKAMLRTVDEVDILVKEWNDGKRPDFTIAAPQSEGESSSKHYPEPMTPQYYLDHIADDSVKQVTVTMDDFENALDELIPSVSAEELERYQTLRRQFDSAPKEKEKLGSEGQQLGGNISVDDDAINGQGSTSSREQFYTPLNEPASSSLQQQPESPLSEATSKMPASKKSKGKGKDPAYAANSSDHI